MRFFRSGLICLWPKSSPQVFQEYIFLINRGIVYNLKNILGLVHKYLLDIELFVKKIIIKARICLRGRTEQILHMCPVRINQHLVRTISGGLGMEFFKWTFLDYSLNCHSFSYFSRFFRLINFFVLMSYPKSFLLKCLSWIFILLDLKYISIFTTSLFFLGALLLWFL